MTTSGMPERDVVEQRLLDFVVEDLGWDGGADSLLGPTARALPEILDSQDLVELAGFVEDEFAIRIDDSEINADTFASLASVAGLVVAKTAAHAAP